MNERKIRIEEIKNIQAQSYVLKATTKREAKTIFQNFEPVEKIFNVDFFESKDIRKKPRYVKEIVRNARSTTLSIRNNIFFFIAKKIP